MMINKLEKPSIKVYVSSNYKRGRILKELCHGIEEEGIPYEVVYKEGTNSVYLGYEACRSSILGVGLGITESSITLHYEKLEEASPLFIVEVNFSLENIRSLGANSARLVKRMPFKAIDK